jgi:hypothetical protein
MCLRDTKQNENISKTSSLPIQAVLVCASNGNLLKKCLNWYFVKWLGCQLLKSEGLPFAKQKL